MTLKQFVSLGTIDESEKISKTQPCYKIEDLTDTRIFPAAKEGQKKKPSTGKRGEHPKSYWDEKKPKRAPQINNDYSKRGISVVPEKVAKAVIEPVKPKVYKGKTQLGRKPISIDADLDFSDVVNKVSKNHPDMDFQMVEEIVSAFWPTLLGIGLGAISAMGKDPIAETRERERISKLGKK